MCIRDSSGLDRSYFYNKGVVSIIDNQVHTGEANHFVQLVPCLLYTSMMDWSVRPNMIFTVAFDYSPLDRAQKKQVLDIVTKDCLLYTSRCV